MSQEEALKDEEEDIESLRYRDLQEIQQKGLSKKEYYEIVTEIRQFITGLGQTRQLDEYRKEVESLLRTLETTYGKVQSDFQLCDNRNKEIYEKTIKVRQLQKQVLEDRQRLAALKVNFVQACNDVDQFRDAESKNREQIELLKSEIAKVTRQLGQEEGPIIKESEKLDKLREEHEETERKKKRLEDMQAALNERLEAANKQVEERKKQIANLKEITENNYKEIDQCNAEHIAGEEKHRTMSALLQKKRDEVERLKVEIEENVAKEREVLNKKALEKQAVDKVEGELAQSKSREEFFEQSIAEAKMQQGKEIDKQKKRRQELENYREDLKKYASENQLLDKENEKSLEEIEALQDLRLQKRSKKEELDAIRKEMRQSIEELNRELERIIRDIELEENNNKSLEKTRNIFNRKLVQEEDKERAIKDLEITYKNQIARMVNETTLYRGENQRLQKQHAQLEKEKKKYTEDATRANVKHWETVEEVREKEKVKEDFQKRNKELEEKLKNQQKLYECVRSDRNLYSKNLVESQEEIKELDRKFKMHTNDINQLKEEKTSKDTQLALVNQELEGMKRKNQIQSGEKEKTEKEINELNQLYKNQSQRIAKLNHIIAEAEAERARQRKDYEMVINERDILGNQLIKRTDELHLLYEKIKIQQSGLAKGKVKYQQLMNVIKELKEEISQRKKEIILAKGEVKCIDDLKKESISLYKEVQEERLKVTMLNEELKKKMNYHKWKELEGKDPATYNLIMKIHSLQRRLIAKTEELAEKDVLIKEKESLYVELKNILAKQSGPEVAEKLEVYQQNLKERMKQLKQYMKELKAYQSQVNAYKYEIERIDGEINGMKQVYFDRKRKEAAGLAPEPIPEENEGGENVEEEDNEDAQEPEDKQEDEIDHQPEHKASDEVSVPVSANAQHSHYFLLISLHLTYELLFVPIKHTLQQQYSEYYPYYFLPNR
eukprot:TRINITY_DN144_c0_g4_i1.p1 TRINITY_DN144_c0_g4~~TRINITY_DN144_c0_g4_i1.p1  ORF type:complete len:953 (-),score=235.09 TRINITY_DN144_c0_g4_i1:4364-7222(-)